MEPLLRLGSVGDTVVIWLTNIFNNSLRTKNMSNEQRNSIIIFIYKDDIQNCLNYHNIKLMSIL